MVERLQDGHPSLHSVVEQACGFYLRFILHMDIKALKLELIERIAKLDDETRLLTLKRLLDAQLGYGIPNEKLSVVKEELDTYLPGSAQYFTLEDVRVIVAAVKEEFMDHDLDQELSPEDVAELDRRREEMVSGKVKGLTWEEVERLLNEDRKRDRE